MESNKKEYLALKNMRHRLVKLQHHEKVYCRSLSENVIPKGLRLKKTPLIGEVSLWFKKQWRGVLYEAERKLLTALKKEVKRKQIEISKDFHKKTGELTLARGDQVVRNWLVDLERCEHRWNEELAARRRKKFSKLLGNHAKRRRRALSREAINDLRTLVSDCVEFNEQITRENEAGMTTENSNKFDIVNKGDKNICEEQSRAEIDNNMSEGGVVQDNQSGETNACLLSGIVNDECNNEQSKFVSDNVINISSRVLTQAEVSLLSRGLKFCPTPIELDISSVKRDIKEFGRKLKCKAFLHSNICIEQEGQTFRQFREKSAWCPTEVAIELYLSKFEERVLAINERGRNFSNLSSEEQEALKNLKKYRDIVIKEADKGGAVVVWGRKDYYDEAYNHLNDQQRVWDTFHLLLFCVL
ncbi:Hypothetical predicted protein [Paramuricea clavata]|uniref:Uncharacterized protein n=1 Tax=Paramuricea clavata TaxID=317549 RepID=A0A7D9I5X5_PARCT|nr:Hypothetical predicted protein [Paramuricea clavata]